MKRRASVEHRTCRRHGLCLAVAPESFEVGRDGRIRVSASADEATIEQMRQAARLCPVQAIKAPAR